MKGIIWPLSISIIIVVIMFIFFNHLEIQFQEFLLGLKERENEYAIFSILILTLDIILPVPSSIIMYLNGSVLGLLAGFTTSLIAVTISVTTGYLIGLSFSHGMSRQLYGKSNELLERYGFFAIIITRGIPILSESICITCGFNRYSFWRYLTFNLIGYIPICLIYAYFGNLGSNQQLFLISFGATLVISLLLGLLGKKMVQMKAQRQ